MVSTRSACLQQERVTAMSNRKMTVKIVGVSPRQLTRLHTLLDEKHSAATYWGNQIPGQPKGEPKKIRHLISPTRDTTRSIGIELLKSHYDKGAGTYTVELALPIDAELTHLEGAPDRVFMPRTMIAAVYDALEIYPDIENGEMRFEQDAFDDSGKPKMRLKVPFTSSSKGKMTFKFRLDAYDGEKRVLEGHETGVHRFQDATDLSNAILHVVTANCRSRCHQEYPVNNMIALPHVDGGYGPDTTIVITEVIPVHVEDEQEEAA